MYGVTASALGSFGITIDGNRVSTLSAKSDVEGHDILLYYVTQLEGGGQHTMTLDSMESNNGGEVGLVVDRWQAWGPPGQVGFV